MLNDRIITIMGFERKTQGRFFAFIPVSERKSSEFSQNYVPKAAFIAKERGICTI